MGFEGNVHQCVYRGYIQLVGGLNFVSLTFNVFQPNVSNFLYNDYDLLKMVCSAVVVVNLKIPKSGDYNQPP